MKRIFFIAVSLISTILVNSQNVLSISGDEVTLSEFENTLMKNNHNQEITKDYLDNYVQLFINYKLKVKQAKDLKLDKDVAFVNELEVYRKQLAKPYLTDKEFKESLIIEVYDRMKYDVNASHILFRLDEQALPTDTLKK